MAIPTLNRRLPTEDPKALEHQPWPNARATVIRLFQWCVTQAHGIPAGFLGTVATAIKAGIAASAGTLTAGWAAANHVHNAETGAAVDLAQANAEGGGTALARAAHTHDHKLRQPGDLLTLNNAGLLVRFKYPDPPTTGWVLTWDAALDPPLKWAAASGVPAPVAEDSIMWLMMLGNHLPGSTEDDEMAYSLMAPAT